MTQVKTLHFDESDEQVDFLKVTYLNGEVRLLDTELKEGVEGVLRDLENGEFDDVLHYMPADEPADVAKADATHVYVLVYGEE